MTAITPAMREWCAAIADLRGLRLYRHHHPDNAAWVRYATEGWPRRLKPSWAMADKLVEVGLIRWRRYGRHRDIATLTPAGRAAANHGVREAVKPRADEWPFPVSTVYPRGSTA